MSLCRGCAVKKNENASRPTPIQGRLRLWSIVPWIRWLLFVLDLPEMHQATNAAALLLRLIGGISRGFLLLAEFAPFGMGSTDQLGETGETRALGINSLAGAPGSSSGEGCRAIGGETASREEGGRGEAIEGVGHG